MGDFLLWGLQSLGLGLYDIAYAILHPGLWLDWLSWDNTTEDKQSLMRFIYFGGSREFFFAVLDIFLILGAAGLASRRFMWGMVRVMEGIANGVGRFFAWAGLLMVLQQIVIVFIQRIFAQAEITIGFGTAVSRDISWWAEELKFYNAMIVALCVTYTFVQGGHVRVDLIYSAVGHRAKRVIDMVGSVLFMMPAATLIWMYAWFFMWRHLITPKVSASDTLERVLLKARAVRWNVETIGFSPNGFNGYFLFKVLMVSFTALVFLQAWAFLFRSYLEWREGEASAGRYLDRDAPGPGQDAIEGAH